MNVNRKQPVEPPESKHFGNIAGPARKKVMPAKETVS